MALGMRAVVQRVQSAAVIADGRETGRIGRGLLVFLGVERDDTADELPWLVGKVAGLRVFEDAERRMNLSVAEIEDGGVLLISQFTLYGNLKKGTRPSFNRAAEPKLAEALYEQFREALSVRLLREIPTGVFGAHMDIDAQNDGPVTLIIDTKHRDF